MQFRFKFSLRSWTICFLLLSIAIGLTLIKLRSCQIGIANLQKLGGVAFSDNFEPVTDAWTDSLFSDVSTVQFLGVVEVGDHDIPTIIRSVVMIGGIKSLIFVDTSITEIGAARIQHELPDVDVRLSRPVSVPVLIR